MDRADLKMELVLHTAASNGVVILFVAPIPLKFTFAPIEVELFT